MEGTRLAAERNGEQTVIWKLNTEGWRADKWKKLMRPNLREGQIAAQGLEVKQIQEAEKKAQREADCDAGIAQRTEREAMAWKARPKGISYRLERLHLNPRRARNRAAKEERAAQDAALRREAEVAARKLLAGEN